MRLEGKTAVIIGGGQAPGLSAAIGNRTRNGAALRAERGEGVLRRPQLGISARNSDQIASAGGTATA